MSIILGDLLEFMVMLGQANGIPFDYARDNLESWRQALRVWHEDGIATIEEVEAFDNYIESLE